jgi:hypothetical protein
MGHTLPWATPCRGPHPAVGHTLAGLAYPGAADIDGLGGRACAAQVVALHIRHGDKKSESAVYAVGSVEPTRDYPRCIQAHAHRSCACTHARVHAAAYSPSRRCGFPGSLHFLLCNAEYC